MQTPFDKIAQTYDDTFTNTVIGKKQRSIVWLYLNEVLLPKQLNILELNCGTGEDAISFAKKGYHVIATDVSEQMLKVTDEKIISHNLSTNISTQILDLNNPDDFIFSKKFDLIFSNFGGINCMGNKALNNLCHILSGMLNDDGRVIFVIMPEFCLLESFYFLLKLKFNNIFRRASSKPLPVQINGGIIQTFYYSPIEISRIFYNNFSVRKIKPIGFFIPPSYLNTFFTTKQKSLNLLDKFERAVSNLSFLSKLSDHFLIDLELKR